MSGSNRSERSEDLDSWWDKTAIPALLIFIGLIVIGLSYGFGRDTGLLETEPHEHSNYYTDRTDEQIHSICGVKSTLADAIKCATQQKNQTYKANDEHRANHDLTAQRSMSRWAWWVIITTFFIGITTAGVTAIGVWFVRNTLIEAKNTTKAALIGAEQARFSAIQAEKQTNIAENSFKLSKRPWVSVNVSRPISDKFGVIPIELISASRRENGSVFIFPIDITIENFGETPAEVIIQHRNFEIDKPELAIKYFSAVRDKFNKVNERFLIFPGQKNTQRDVIRCKGSYADIVERLFNETHCYNIIIDSVICIVYKDIQTGNEFHTGRTFRMNSALPIEDTKLNDIRTEEFNIYMMPEGSEAT